MKKNIKVSMNIKYIKVMPDYVSTGLWDDKGMMLSLWDIPFIEVSDKDTFARLLFSWLRDWEDADKKNETNQDKKLIELGTHIGSLLKGIVPEDVIVEFTYDGVNKILCEPKPIWVKVDLKLPKKDL